MLGSVGMYILNLEDDFFKHHDICKAIENGTFNNIKIDCIGNLEEGINAIENMLEMGKTYDLIITDMWYPKMPGGVETNAGEMLINIAKDNGWNIPIILCSSVDYRIPGILGSVHYSENSDWERELVTLIRIANKEN